MKISKVLGRSFVGMFCYAFLSMQAVYGDDTEIFFVPEEDVDNIIPNVMFIIDTSGSMDNKPSGSTQTRIEIVKEVMDDVLTKITNVNVGLMRFNKGVPTGYNSSEGGPVVFPVTFIDDPADPSISILITNGDNDGEEVDGIGTVTLDAEVLNIGETSNTVTALRFKSLLIPQGAEITSASLVFTANGDSSAVASLNINAENVDDSAALDSTNFSISTRKANSTGLVNWIPEVWTDGEPYASEDLTVVVQEVVDRVGWCGGNAMTFFITSNAGNDLRSAYTVEGSAADSSFSDFYPSPKLKVKFKNVLPPGASGCTAIELSTKINDSDHDWVRRANGNYRDGDGVLDVFNTWNSNSNDGIGLSFTDLNIPPGATISEAYLTFTPRRTFLGAGETNISALIDTLTNPEPDDAPALYSANHVGSVNWLLGTWNENVPVQTDDISSLVQSIVNDNWSIDNTMSFYLKGVSGRHRAFSSNSSTKAPQLYIAYSGTYEPGVITKREEMKATVAGFPANSYTPISDTMAEAGRYFKGDKVFYGIDRDNVKTNVTSHIDSFDSTGTLDTPVGCTTDNYSASICAGERITGNPNYISPISESCQTSHIVFLTDGFPTSHHSATQDIYNEWSSDTCSVNSSFGNYGSECAVKIAYYLKNNDQNDLLTGKQTVTTHTIGFDIDFQLLKDMASSNLGGGGSYYTADTKDGLIEAINDIVTDIASVNTSFVSSGVSVNQYNRLTHNDELYFSLFAPASGNVWPGNIKRYKLVGNQIVDSHLPDPKVAVGDNGQFIDSAKSWWSSVVDGNSVDSGGAAENRGFGRIVYSNISGDIDIDLTIGSNTIRDSNISVTEAMLGATDAADRTTILDWAQGLDVNILPLVQPHNVIGDPLHSQPNLVIYNTGTVASPTFVTKVYVGTNHGFLHAFDSETGEDSWSFIPQELLTRLSDLQKGSAVPHSYGLDGGIATYISDDNNNGVVDIAEGEKIYLYVGMRRGGSSYYAVDISDPIAPILMFKISPEKTGFGSIAGSDGLGETWSTPIVKRMNIAGEEDRLVLLFGGGYDIAQDNAGTSANIDSVGNLVYIVDATTGDHLWNSRDTTLVTQASSSAGLLTDMNSVVSDISALDLTGDGLVDTFYASDTKAQIFRFDVDNDTQTITGGKIASLQNVSDVANNRRFYYKPDTALIRTTEETFISISIGSGYRAHPLDKDIDDNFYMIKDKGGLSGTFDMLVERSDLVDVTNLLGDTDGDGVSNAKFAIDDTGAKGWYLTFSADGEKVIDRSLTFNNAVLFTTYIPSGSGTNVCEAIIGNSRLYAVKIIDGNPYRDNLADVPDIEDRYTLLDSPGISPPPQPLFNDEIRLCVGTQCDLGHLLPPTPDGIMGIRWRRQPD